jgi:ATP synthase protein I
MTTDSPRRARPYGVAALGVAVLAASAVGVVVALVAVLVQGSTGLLGALLGAGVTLLVLATGFAVVDLVAGLMPAASLMVALLTYTLQIALMALLLVALRGADDVAATLSPDWFAAGVIGVALTWTVCLVVHQLTARIPLYDLPSESPAEGVSDGAVRAPEGSER